MPEINWLGLLVQVAKTVGLYAMALTGFRLMGKRCLGDMEPLDFVIVIAIAEIVGAPLADPGLRILPPIIAVATLTLVQIGLAHLSLWSPRLQRILEGAPTVVIRGGRLLPDNLRRAKVSVTELMERLRERGFLDPSDVELAMLETDGMLSAIPRKEATPVTPRFLGRGASITLLIRGKTDAKALEAAGMTRAQLEAALRRRGLEAKEVEQVIRDPRGRLQVTLSLEEGLKRRRRKETGTRDTEG